MGKSEREGMCVCGRGDVLHFALSLRQISALLQILAWDVPLPATFHSVLGNFSIVHIGNDVKLQEDGSLTLTMIPETFCWGD